MDLSELDHLMQLDPLNLTKENVDKIIELQRKLRAGYESGAKPEKITDGPKITIDIEALGLKPKTEPVKRRI